MQTLFLWDTNGDRDVDLGRRIVEEGTEDELIRRSALEMAAGTWEQRQMVDERVERVAPQWPPRRQPAVDRNLIRLAVWELTNTNTPPKVVLDEAIEMAKEFSTEQSPAFINGVLDAVLREHRALIGEQGTQGEVGTEARRHEGTKEDSGQDMAPSQQNNEIRGEPR